MKLSSLGEHGIIEIFSRAFDGRKCRDVKFAIGDDCAVIKLGGGVCLLVSTDTMLEHTHIPSGMSPGQIGGYAVNAVLSDIAAMGGKPIGLVFSVALPPDMDEEFVEKLAESMESAAKAQGTCIIGGDTQEGREITLTGTALGRVMEKNLLLRSNARVGDTICVTGSLGSAAAGVQCFVDNLDGFDGLIKKALEPKARIEEGQTISKYANSCIDISDGLAWSVHEIVKRSGVGARVYYEKIPVHKELEKLCMNPGVSMREMVLYGGGDFELLFTVDPEKYSELEKDIENLGSKISAIGEVVKSGVMVIDSEGHEAALEERGWEAFKR